MTAVNADTLGAVLARCGKTLRRSQRYWTVYLFGACLAAVAALAAPRLLRPIYVSQTVLLHRELVQSTTLLGRDAPQETQRQRGTRLRDMLMARSNLEPILREEKLYPEIVSARGVNEAIDELLKDADCRVGEDTYTIKFSYRDPDIAFRVTQRLAESLVTQSARYRLEQAQSTRGFLEAQRKRTENELQAKEQALAEFLAGHPEFAQDVAGGGALTAGASIRAQQRKAAAIDPMIDGLQRQRLRIAQRLQAASTPGAVILPIDDSDPTMNEALSHGRADLERAASELAELRSRYTDAHPDVVAARRRLELAKLGYDAARGQVQPGRRPTAIEPPASGEEQKQRLAGELRALDDDLTRARKKRSREAPGSETENWIVDLETQWTALNRDVFEVRERYQQIQRRYFQAAIIANVEASGDAAQMVVVDPAFRPDRPAARGPKRVSAAAAAIAMLLGVIGALGAARFDDRVCGEDDLRAMGLGGISHALPAMRKRARV